METDDVIKTRIESILPMLNERQRRIYLSAEAKSIGWGGKSKISQLSSVTRRTIAKGEIESSLKNRIRKEGGGRKKSVEQQPEIQQIIEDLVSPHTLGDPMNPLIWTSKSLRKIAAELLVYGYEVSHELVRKSLISLGYSLQANKKTKEGGEFPDRDAQFVFINETAKEFAKTSDPVISVDCKKKELIGEYKNNGQEWTPIKNPTEVNVYDFIDKTNGKASPYGVYDIQNNCGWVNVGVSSDTAAFAVSTIRDWWKQEGCVLYPDSNRLYINADGGGSNGSRNHLWKAELQQFSNESGLNLHISHFPPGTSKWNKIEHRLFAYISKNWRAKPLTSLMVIVSLINATTTTTGLKVRANLDEKIYATGIKVTEEEKNKLNIQRNDFHGEWNYTISPNL
ncbi:MAG TPA: ISAzo13 family transposase [Thermoplasmata archaeon]|nr:MAG TPA: ISAzo13 family transposase [Thermoplasmata archaeon]